MGLEAYRHVAGVGGVVQHRLVVLVGVTQQAFAAVLYSSIPHTHTHTHTHIRTHGTLRNSVYRRFWNY